MRVCVCVCLPEHLPTFSPSKLCRCDQHVSTSPENYIHYIPDSILETALKISKSLLFCFPLEQHVQRGGQSRGQGKVAADGVDHIGD